MIESFKKNRHGILLMLVSALSLSVGQLLWRNADLSDIGTKLSTFQGIVSVILAVLPGFIIYAVGALVMTIALGMGELSILQPVNTTSYVFALILSAIFIPDEPITPMMIIGVVVIIAGVILIGGSSK